MSKLIWDESGKKTYETGLDRGVLYPQLATDGTYPKGVAWNGLVSVSENPSGAESNKKYADNTVYLNLTSAEEFGATIEAFTYPDEFAACDGSAEVAVGVVIGQQTRSTFGLCYRTILGNDTKESDYGYKIHIVYGAKASPTEKGYQTVNETPEAITFSWEVSTTPVQIAGFKPSATMIVDSIKCDPTKLAALEEILYGKDAATEPAAEAVDPRLPSPDEIIELIGSIAQG